MEYDRQKKKERLDIATKQLKTTLVKENMRQLRMSLAKDDERRKKEYGKVVYETGPRSVRYIWEFQYVWWFIFLKSPLNANANHFHGKLVIVKD